MRRVQRHGDFHLDHQAHLRWIEGRGEERWALALLNEIVRVSALLQDFPSIGLRRDKRGTLELRQIAFARLPYVAWYVFDPADPTGDLWLVRLFHARQLRPAPHVDQWMPPL